MAEAIDGLEDGEKLAEMGRHLAEGEDTYQRDFGAPAPKFLTIMLAVGHLMAAQSPEAAP